MKENCNGEKKEHELTLEELLNSLNEQIIRTQSKQDLSSETYRLLQELGNRELLTTVQITKLLLERFIEKGVLEELSRREFLEILPWEKSQLSKRLQNLVREKILLFDKRKYSLDLANPFVLRIKRIINFETKEFDLTELLKKFVKEKCEHEEDKQQPKLRKVRYRKISKQEFREFVSEIFEIAMTQESAIFKENEELTRFIEKNILKTIGWTIVKEH
ncbi:MAG: hypothetical protein ACTSUC_00805 [Promethearchaeota archaeon]